MRNGGLLVGELVGEDGEFPFDFHGGVVEEEQLLEGLLLELAAHQLDLLRHPGHERVELVPVLRLHVTHSLVGILLQPIQHHPDVILLPTRNAKLL